MEGNFLPHGAGTVRVFLLDTAPAAPTAAIVPLRTDPCALINYLVEARPSYESSFLSL